MNNSEPINEELLSAYLDGELSKSESLRVKKRVAEDASLRATLSELEKIREEIRQLPRHKLSSDFAAKLTQSIEQQQKESPKPTTQRTTTPPRRLAATLAAIAALLFISIWGIRYLPNSINTAMGPAASTESRADREMKQATESSAAPARQQLRKLAEFDGDVRDLQRESEAIEAAPSFTAPALAATKSERASLARRRTDPYDLVLDYELDAQKLDFVATSWEAWKTAPPPTNRDARAEEANVTEYVIEGTPEEIRTALVGLRSAPTKQLAETQLGMSYENRYFFIKEDIAADVEDNEAAAGDDVQAYGLATNENDARAKEGVTSSSKESLHDSTDAQAKVVSPAGVASATPRYAVPAAAAPASEFDGVEELDDNAEAVRMRILVRIRSK